MYIEKLELAKCPHCGKEAFGGDIETDFGYRTCDDRPQSWCRECRGESAKNSYRKQEVTA